MNICSIKNFFKARKELNLVKKLSKKHFDGPPIDYSQIKRFTSQSGHTVYSLETPFKSEYIWGFDPKSNPIKIIQKLKAKYKSNSILRLSIINHKKNTYTEIDIIRDFKTKIISINKEIQKLINGKKAKLEQDNPIILSKDTIEQLGFKKFS